MTTETRKPLPPALLARIRATGNAAVLAGCDADETIRLCKATVEAWLKEGNSI